ncbi:hypothetical protein MDA_GLEAN10007289 [Myotis davidii]|uniref:Uncharacterized protein n=1 Tax=Myotis davidii TaxID=225400 RepID=L5LUT8_MYODS|nr:hypothetical protein MDA_GLEAN10007289 [Myotis davidii]
MENGFYSWAPESYDPLCHTPLGNGGHNMDSQVQPNPKRQAFFSWGPGIGDFGTSSSIAS